MIAPEVRGIGETFPALFFPMRAHYPIDLIFSKAGV
jgi:hypothetical protein